MVKYTMCLNEFKSDEELSLLPCCSNVFHLDCVDAWLASHLICLIYHVNLAEQAIDDSLDLLLIATFATEATSLQLETSAPP
ncbi:hypothetical protein GW17_00017072 [Ensete ventricosum]|nr:hypothetical protein GW17_00017072 [Ensete ventricosum]